MEHSLVVCEGPGHLGIVTVREHGASLDRQAVAAEGLWPCWSPDGQAIAVSTLRSGRGEVQGSIELLDARGQELRTAHLAVPGAPPVIAPRVPHYVNWAPDSATLSFVAPGTEALGLHLSDRSGSYSSDRIATGAPLFSAWSEDSALIAIHAGTELSLYDVASRSSRVVSGNAVGFRAPVFAGGRLVYATPSPPGVIVMSAATGDPGDVREIGRFDGGVVLQLAGGDAPMISVSVTREPDSGNFNEVVLLDPVHGERQRVVSGPFAAAIWSPGGERVAAVTPTQTGDGRYAIQVFTREGRYAAVAEAFVPSQDFRLYIGFFDQYLLSHRLWSPDGTALALAGRLAGDGTAWSFADRQNDYAWYWPVEKSSPLVRIGPGDSVFFRPS